MDARATAAPTTVASPAEPAPEQPLTAKNIEAFDAAQAVLAKVIASRRFTRASQGEFYAALSGATPEQRREMQRELMKQVNHGEIQYDLEGE